MVALMVTYSTNEAAERAGMSYRMVDYMIRQDVIRPTVDADGSGSRREWSARDVEILVVLGRIGEAMRVDGHTASAGLLRRVRECMEQGGSQVELVKGVWLSWSDG